MALVHPGRSSVHPVKGELHPVVPLLVGFGLMIAIATGVHMLFGLL
ncbi:hypothetical protein [Brevundimonas vesicularis]